MYPGGLSVGVLFALVSMRRFAEKNGPRTLVRGVVFLSFVVVVFVRTQGGESAFKHAGEVALSPPRATFVFTFGRVPIEALNHCLESHLEGSKSDACSFMLSELEWLAKGILTESNLPHEQRVVGWVIRSRVEQCFEGCTYEEVVTKPGQFSAFNDGGDIGTRRLDITQSALGWDAALNIAVEVLSGEESDRPLPRDVLHFYSPISMDPPQAEPWWVDQLIEVEQPPGIDPNRFRFFSAMADLR